MNNLIVEDAKIIFRNFAGAETDFNRKGDRNFCLVIDSEEDALQLRADGWNVKERTSGLNPDEKFYFVKVSVRFDHLPPRVRLYSGNSKTDLTADTIGILDKIDIETVDLVVSPYHWSISNKSGTKEGIKAYLSSMYIRQKLDRLASKWDDVGSEEEFPFVE